jgi:hypothetical protein
MSRFSVQTSSHLSRTGWIGAVLLVAGPVVAAIGWWVFSVAVAAGASPGSIDDGARAQFIVGVLMLVVGAIAAPAGLVAVLVGRSYEHDVEVRQ